MPSLFPPMRGAFSRVAKAGLLALLSAAPPAADGAGGAASIELFAGNSATPLAGPEVTVPFQTSAIRFQVHPAALLARYRLEGLDPGWLQQNAEMLFMVRFLDRDGNQIAQDSFPVSGRSAGWNGTVADSVFTRRKESVTVPPGAAYLSVATSSAGPAVLVGVFAVKDIAIRSQADAGSPARTLMSNSQVAGAPAPLWVKSGTRPSMASVVESEGAAPVLVIEDDDIAAHADWASGIYSIPVTTPGKTLVVEWQEAYSTGSGGEFSIVYERLPPGSYRFVVEDLSITGDPLGTVAARSITVPLPYWKNAWFWGAVAAAAGVLATVTGRQMIRRRIQLHLQQAQLIADERLRIARDLHDDLGTRLSHISLLGSYAGSNIHDEDARAAFRQIAGMSRELIGALSETVWMLNPKNNELEALVDFLCRLVSELCRLAEIRCRIDAMSVDEHRTISHEFRHNVSLAVKETVHNALKHSLASEIRMTVRLEDNRLKITIADNGIGIARETGKTGVGLESIGQRMASIRGKCTVVPLEKEGLEISLEAPIS